MTSKASVEDAIKQLVLANADGEVKSLVFIMINNDGEPEMQIAMAPGTAYAIVTSLEVLKINIISKIIKDGGIEPKERE
jgi:hypothetical protein